VTSVIHDIGYQRYEGARLGRAYAVRSLYAQGVRSAFGIGRSAKAKIFPWIITGIVGAVAVVLASVRAVTGQKPMEYWAFPGNLAILVILFGAVVAPELVSRDLKAGVLPLYFSRPLTRYDYALAKVAALITSIFLMVAGPLLVMYIAGAFTVDGFTAVRQETVDFGKSLAVAAVTAVVFGAISLLFASFTGRRMIASAIVVAVFLGTQPIHGILLGIGHMSDEGPTGGSVGASLQLAHLSGLASPMSVVQGLGTSWFGDPYQFGGPGPYGWLFAVVAAVLTVLCLIFLLLRYRKVAR
jgi:ABC-2 type transport system permease protein